MCFVTWLMQISIYYLLGSGIVDILKKPRLAKTTPSFVNKVSAQNKTLFFALYLVLTPGHPTRASRQLNFLFTPHDFHDPLFNT